MVKAWQTRPLDPLYAIVYLNYPSALAAGWPSPAVSSKAPAATSSPIGWTSQEPAGASTVRKWS